MCFNRGGGSAAALPVTPIVAPPPTRENVTASNDTTTFVNETKARISKRLGVFGNVKTTPMGDASYGAFAAFGKRTAS